MCGLLRERLTLNGRYRLSDSTDVQPGTAAVPCAPADTSPPHTLVGEFETHQQFHSRHLETPRDVIVYLPPGYGDHPARRYPVLYLHDGQNVFDAATAFSQEWCVDETAQWLISEGAIDPLIIVGVYNGQERRIDEYTPTPDRNRACGGCADAYGRMLVEELKPFIDSLYRTRPDAASTGLGGSSLGGLVSLHLGLKYPDVFGHIAALSPSAWWDERVIVREVEALPSKLPLRIWLDAGTAEGDYVIADARTLRDALVAKGWVLDTDLHYLEAEGAGHDEGAWAARVEHVLRFLFPRVWRTRMREHNRRVAYRTTAARSR